MNSFTSLLQYVSREAPMPFSMRSFRCLPLTYFRGFWFLITLLLLSSSPAYAEWMSLGASDSGTTVYADLATMRREGDLVKMLVLFDFKGKEKGTGYFSLRFGSYFA